MKESRMITMCTKCEATGRQDKYCGQGEHSSEPCEQCEGSGLVLTTTKIEPYHPDKMRRTV